MTVVVIPGSPVGLLAFRAHVDTPRMRVVILYGPPGVGKLTVGTELAALTGYKLLHNHLSVDLVSAVFPRQSEPWIRLLREIRRTVLAEAARENVDLVCTGVGRGTPEFADAMRGMLEPVYAGGGTVAFVRLTCARDELVRRVQSQSRRVRKKLTDPTRLLAEYDLDAVIPLEPQITLDTTDVPPRAAARRIAAHYSLPVADERANRT